MENIVPALTIADKRAIRKQYGAVGDLYFIPVQYLPTIPPEALNSGSFPYSDEERTERWCYTCIAFKKVEKFHRVNSNRLIENRRGQPGGYCKDCNRERTRDQRRASNLKKNHQGFTSEQYAKMFEAQGGVCAICKQPETRVHYGKVLPLAVDHSHTTDTIRELLCLSCNQTLGRMNEDPERLRALADYAEKWKGL